MPLSDKISSYNLSETHKIILLSDKNTHLNLSETNVKISLYDKIDDYNCVLLANLNGTTEISQHAWYTNIRFRL